MLFSLILSLFAATAVFAHDHHGSKACARELEGIVYVPQNCAYNYLRKITEVLRVQSPLLWTNQAQSVINTFASTYGVQVVVINALGEVGSIDAAGQFEAISGAMAMGHAYARSNALGEGFTSNYPAIPDVSPISDHYTSIFWNPNGEMYTISVQLDSSKAPSFC